DQEGGFNSNAALNGPQLTGKKLCTAIVWVPSWSNGETVSLHSALTCCRGDYRAQRSADAPDADHDDIAWQSRNLVKGPRVGQRMEVVVGKAFRPGNTHVLRNRSLRGRSLAIGECFGKAAGDQCFSQRVSKL